MKFAGLTTYTPAEIRNKNLRQVTAGNIPPLKGTPNPAVGLTVYAGWRGISAGLTQARTASFEGVLDDSSSVAGGSRLRDLPNVTILNLRAADAALSDRIYELFTKYLMDSGAPIPAFSHVSHNLHKLFTNHAHLIDSLWQEPAFNHLDAIIYPAKNPNGFVSLRCTIFRVRAVRDLRVPWPDANGVAVTLNTDAKGTIYGED